MADLGLTVRPEWVINCEWDDRKCAALPESTFRMHRLPTACCAAGDLLDIASLRTLYQLCVQVPDRVAVIGMSNIEMSQYANPPSPPSMFRCWKQGIAAALIITARIRGDRTLPKRVLLPSRLIERDSVKAYAFFRMKTGNMRN